MKKEIRTRKDVFELVNVFYTKIRANQVLGPIFEKHIQNWPKHIERLTDFWETNLFFVRKFKGNPLLKHQIVDAASNYTLDEKHFGIWLNLWFETLDDLFHGEKVNIAKNRARTMGTFFHINLFNARPKTT